MKKLEHYKTIAVNKCDELQRKFWVKYIGNKTISKTYPYFCTAMFILYVWCIILTILIIK